MIDFTNAFNNISYLYQHQQRDVIQYHFMLHGYHINVAYTKCAGLSRQISGTFGEYMSLLYPFFENFTRDGRISTTVFFEELTVRLESLTMDDLRYENIHEFSDRIKHTKHPRSKNKSDDYYNPYFFNIIHKNLSDRMRQKIFDMYDNPHEIIKFLKSNGLTLAFTEDINKARDFYTVFNQRRLEIEGKC